MPQHNHNVGSGFTSKNQSSFRFHPVSYVALCAIMAMIFGFNLGHVYACKPEIMDKFLLDSREIDSVMGTFLLGAIIGVFLGGRVTYDAGRRLPLIGSFLLGSLAIVANLLAPAFSSYLVSEFVVGGAFGIFFVSSLIYVAEIIFPDSRGLWTSMIGLSVILGAEIGVLLGDIIFNNAHAFAAAILVLSLLLAIVSFFRIPESPRWLALSGFADAALAELIRLRNNTAAAARELADINECGRGENRGIALFLHSGSYRHKIWLLASVTILCHLSSFAIFPYMSLQLVSSFQRVIWELDEIQAYDYHYGYLKAAITVILLSAVTVVLTIDRIGRKKLLLGSIFATEVILILLYLITLFTGSRGFMFMGTLVLLYIFTATIGIVVFFCTMVSEILPAQGRELGVALTFFINLVGMLAGFTFFESLTSELGLRAFFALDILFGALLFALSYHSLPELRGKSLEDLELTSLRGH